MRDSFKKTAETNTQYVNENMPELITGAWQLASRVNGQIDICSGLVAHDKRKSDLMIMMSNSVSDICCCLDGLERGHDRTIENNLRMIFEDFYSVLYMSENEKAYNDFVKSDLTLNDALLFSKRQPGFEKFGSLYGLQSKVAHHYQNYNLLARQIVSINENGEVLFSHLKLIQHIKLTGFLSKLLSITFFLRAIGELAEKISIDILKDPYFWIKSENNLERNFNIEEQPFLEALISKWEDNFKAK